ncbi:hypothetical protein [Paraburkholderia sp. DHOC27]|uniref:hypothetical protein n=1 Tax=Paraburkholderia sp. DHOC27 TaxID=2303330 RepID=UPI000E3D7F8D|nr:hypothetical protein [Paraburkholderia sp. DHOC27]RFU49647.1 hypothetical protein D0B32_07680 [Paraburkholderia sp. DHOC27]
MERAYPYRGYSIKVRAEPQIEPATLSDPFHALGFVSVVEILSAKGPMDAFPRLHLTEANGHGFLTCDEALAHGFTAGQRLVDDLRQTSA